MSMETLAAKEATAPWGCTLVRELIAGRTAAATVAVAPSAFAQWQPSHAIRTRPSRSSIRASPATSSASPRSSGSPRLRWCEGPGVVRRRALPAVERHPEQPHHAVGRGDRRVSVFRKPSNYANGNTRDRQGRLLTCEHGARRVTRTEYDGTITVDRRPLRGQAAQFAERRRVQVRRLDLVHRSAVRHPRLLRGHIAKPELPTNVYRVDPARPAAGGGRRRRRTARTGSRSRPTNRSSTSSSRASPPRVIQVVRRRRRRHAAHQQAHAHRRRPRHARRDALRRGRQLWCGWGMGEEGLDGVTIFNPDGKLIGRIDLPERCANLCFGGTHRNRLFMAASTSSTRCT